MAAKPTFSRHVLRLGVFGMVFSAAVVVNAVSLTVDDQAPVAGVSGPTTASPGEALSFNLTATDDEPDAVAGFTYDIDWENDGIVDETVPATANNGAGVAVTHAFTQLGVNTVSVTATDQNGEVSAPVTHNVTVILLSLEVLPGSVSLNSNGPLRVNVFSTDYFDVATLDLETLLLSGVAAVSAAFKDVDHDGILDLVLEFSREDFLGVYAAALVADLTDGTLDDNHQEIDLALTAQTQGGADILGAGAADFFMTGRRLAELLATL